MKNVLLTLFSFMIILLVGASNLNASDIAKIETKYDALMVVGDQGSIHVIPSLTHDISIDRVFQRPEIMVISRRTVKLEYKEYLSFEYRSDQLDRSQDKQDLRDIHSNEANLSGDRYKSIILHRRLHRQQHRA